jgi:hypothetical protein
MTRQWETVTGRLRLALLTLAAVVAAVGVVALLGRLYLAAGGWTP